MIPRLEDMTIGQRIALTFIIVLIILFAFALAGFLTGRWEEAQAQQREILPPRVSTKWDARILELDLEALDRAYIENSVRLFSVWMRDESDQPRRMLVGLSQSRRAYNEARDRIETHKRDVEQEKIKGQRQ